MNTGKREILIFVGIIGSAFLYLGILKDYGIGLMLLFLGYPAYLLIRLLIWLIMTVTRYCGNLKIEQKPFLNKTTISIGVFIVAVVLIYAGNLYKTYKAYEELEKGPTAIVIDAETGKPIEGAIALAQWFSAGGGALFEGGVDNLEKTAEAYSDKDGNIFIKDYWGNQKYSRRLTVYMPGYVLWDCRWLCPTLEHRTDFDENRRTVKLLKFESEAPKWVTAKPIRNAPRSMHDSFFQSCCRDTPGETKFVHIFRDNELPQLKKEKEKTSLFYKGLESRRPLHARDRNKIWLDDYKGKYADLGNGIIRDTVSGLEWQQATASGTYNWVQALDYCDNLTLGGYHDWRLPTLYEEKTLHHKCINELCSDSSIAYFNFSKEVYFWSSTTPFGNSKFDAGIENCMGSSTVQYSPKDAILYVRCVRGGL